MARPHLALNEQGRVIADHVTLGRFCLPADEHPAGDPPRWPFTENETNYQRLFGHPDPSPYFKDAFHRFVIQGHHDAVNPAGSGTKASVHYLLNVPAHSELTIPLVDARISVREEGAICRILLAEEVKRRRREFGYGGSWFAAYHRSRPIMNRIILLGISRQIYSLIMVERTWRAEVRGHRCCWCDTPDRFSRHGRYEEYLYGQRIAILRVRCRSCRRTHALIPAFSIPWSSFGADEIPSHLKSRSIARADREKNLNFEFFAPLECVPADAMHAIGLSDGKGKRRKAMPLAFLDDATRSILYARFSFTEDSLTFESGIKHILSAHGRIGKLYGPPRFLPPSLCLQETCSGTS